VAAHSLVGRGFRGRRRGDRLCRSAQVCPSRQQGWLGVPRLRRASHEVWPRRCGPL